MNIKRIIEWLLDHDGGNGLVNLMKKTVIFVFFPAAAFLAYIVLMSGVAFLASKTGPAMPEYYKELRVRFDARASRCSYDCRGDVACLKRRLACLKFCAYSIQGDPAMIKRYLPDVAFFRQVDLTGFSDEQVRKVLK